MVAITCLFCSREDEPLTALEPTLGEGLVTRLPFRPARSLSFLGMSGLIFFFTIFSITQEMCVLLKHPNRDWEMMGAGGGGWGGGSKVFAAGHGHQSLIPRPSAHLSRGASKTTLPRHPGLVCFHLGPGLGNPVILLAQAALGGLSRLGPSYPLYSCWGYKVCTNIICGNLIFQFRTGQSIGNKRLWSAQLQIGHLYPTCPPGPETSF